MHISRDFPAPGCAVTIKELSTETIYKAQGETVQMMCSYALDPSETGNLDIEWALMNTDPTALDTVIMTYMDKQVISKAPPGLQQRLHFSAQDPSQGDASIIITYLEVKDTGTYECKVKKNPGLASRKVTVNVLVKPSKPQCWVDGEQAEGKDVTLKCKSDQGSPPLTYKWEKISGDSTTVPPSMNAGILNGDLLIRNNSKAYAGTYRCSAVNNVGHDECTVILSASGGNRVGIIVGAVLGALLLLLLLLLLIWCLICCCNKKRYEKEIANDIREDVAAPPSNPSSRFSSIRTAMAYRPHHISYSLRKKYNAASTEDQSHPNQAGRASSRGSSASNAASARPARVPSQRSDASNATPTRPTTALGPTSDAARAAAPPRAHPGARLQQPSQHPRQVPQLHPGLRGRGEPCRRPARSQPAHPLQRHAGRRRARHDTRPGQGGVPGVRERAGAQAAWTRFFFRAGREDPQTTFPISFLVLQSPSLPPPPQIVLGPPQTPPFLNQP
ncbi:V-set and immunoglobulin domain-containing protein 8 isoform X2 [Rhinatrema bivittatum]|uniref:V-set and immunoglobulin domain-containing protein 8 isoform X2 n=1 Tax=Rhinatrema bivittatum TaxID=194408 RepID=UPI001128F953|nr:V-set and immunoglobulin domain-containing protein 8 isoform X2 [Rhinatrema bivittatum]